MKIDTWNDKMFAEHPTPYYGLAGLFERSRINKVKAYAGITSHNSVLELGCEQGNLLLTFYPVKRLVGFDISRKALKQAQIEAKKRNVPAKFVWGDITKKLPFKRGEFDVIVCSETLEHVVKPEKAIANIAGLCTKDTKVVLTVPDEYLKLKLKKILNTLGLMRILLPMIEKEQSEWHLHAFTRSKLHSLVAPYFRIEKSGSIWGLHEIVRLKYRG